MFVRYADFYASVAVIFICCFCVQVVQPTTVSVGFVLQYFFPAEMFTEMCALGTIYDRFIGRIHLQVDSFMGTLRPDARTNATASD